jgi:hypothetical protein
VIIGSGKLPRSGASRTITDEQVQQAATMNLVEKPGMRPHGNIHFTPTYSSCLNPVEGFFRIITDKQIRRASFNSLKSLREAIDTFIHKYNKDPKLSTWAADADLTIGKVQKFVASFADTTLVREYRISAFAIH